MYEVRVCSLSPRHAWTDLSSVRPSLLLTLTRQCAQTELDGETVKSILAEYKIHNADVTLRDDVTADDLIDVVEGNR